MPRFHVHLVPYDLENDPRIAASDPVLIVQVTADDDQQAEALAQRFVAESGYEWDTAEIEDEDSMPVERTS